MTTTAPTSETWWLCFWVEYDLVQPTRNGRELVDGAALHKPDLVIAEVSMPILNGFEAFKQIRLPVAVRETLAGRIFISPRIVLSRQ